MIPDWIFWVDNFRFLFYQISVQNQCGAWNFETQLRNPTLTFPVQLPLGRNTYLLFNSDLVNFVSKMMRGRQKALFCYFFVFWRCFNRRSLWGGGVGAESLIYGQLNSITVRMEYLSAFQFGYCELCLENLREGGRKHFSLFFVFWKCF